MADVGWPNDPRVVALSASERAPCSFNATVTTRARRGPHQGSLLANAPPVEPPAYMPGFPRVIRPTESPCPFVSAPGTGREPSRCTTGSSQVGKSTLVADLAASDYPARFVNLDDEATANAARADPAGFIAGRLNELVRARDGSACWLGASNRGSRQRVVAVRPKTPFVPFFERPARQRTANEHRETTGSVPGIGVCKERERRGKGPVFAHRGIEIR